MSKSVLLRDSHRYPEYPVYGWGPLGVKEYDRIIDPNSWLDVCEWTERFSGNNRLPNDVGIPLARCVIAAYQIGYMYDFLNLKEGTIVRQSYFEEALGSCMIHTIAAFQMCGRDPNLLLNNFGLTIDSINTYLLTSFEENIKLLSESMFKFQRWILYDYIGRKKRWDEKGFEQSFTNVILNILRVFNEENNEPSHGLAICMFKLQDHEIKNH